MNINSFLDIILLFCNIHVLSPLEIKVILLHYDEILYLQAVLYMKSNQSQGWVLLSLLINLRLLIVCLFQQTNVLGCIPISFPKSLSLLLFCFSSPTEPGSKQQLEKSCWEANNHGRTLKTTPWNESSFLSSLRILWPRKCHHCILVYFLGKYSHFSIHFNNYLPSVRHWTRTEALC